MRKEKEHHQVLFEKELYKTEDADKTEDAESKKKDHSTSAIVDNNRLKLILSYLRGTVAKPNAIVKHQLLSMCYDLVESDGNEVLSLVVVQLKMKKIKHYVRK